MSAPRARANHSLYLAKILLGTWRAELEKEDIPSRTLGEAFMPAARSHLVDAYGWFLLEVSQLDNAASTPPRSIAELPDIPEGRAEAGELRAAIETLKTQPAPPPQRVEVPVIPAAVTEALAEIAARAEALAEAVEGN